MTNSVFTGAFKGEQCFTVPVHCFTGCFSFHLQVTHRNGFGLFHPGILPSCPVGAVVNEITVKWQQIIISHN